MKKGGRMKGNINKIISGLFILIFWSYGLYLNAEDSQEKLISEIKQELINNGIGIKYVSGIEKQIKTLVKNGAPAEEVGNIVSYTVKEAQRQGLKGRALALRVHEAIRARHKQLKEKRVQVREIKRLEKQMQRKIKRRKK